MFPAYPSFELTNENKRKLEANECKMYNCSAKRDLEENYLCESCREKVNKWTEDWYESLQPPLKERLRIWNEALRNSF